MHRLLTCTSSGHSHTQRQVSLCLCGFSWWHKISFGPSECLWYVCGLILDVISPLLPSFWGFSFACGHRVSLFGGIQHFPVDGCSAASFNFRVLTEDACMSFYSNRVEREGRCNIRKGINYKGIDFKLFNNNLHFALIRLGNLH